jgi:hypothetical protein
LLCRCEFSPKYFFNLTGAVARPPGKPKRISSKDLNNFNNEFARIFS